MRYLIIAFLAMTSVASAQSDYEIQSSDWPSMSYVAHRDVVDYAGMSQFYGQYLPAAYQTVASAGLIPGTATGLYYAIDEEAGEFDMAAAVPFSGEAPKSLPDGFEIIEVPESNALSIDYYGPYESLSDAHDAMGAHMAAEEMEAAFLVVEEYITDPTTEPDSSQWLTRIHYLFAK